MRNYTETYIFLRMQKYTIYSRKNYLTVLVLALFINFFN